MIRQASGIASLEIDEEPALHAARLPGLDSDPLDRILGARATVHGMTILTPDPETEQYAARMPW
jgi:PIN domain nuclease of toxin-antitoxin system